MRLFLRFKVCIRPSNPLITRLTSPSAISIYPPPPAANTSRPCFRKARSRFQDIPTNATCSSLRLASANHHWQPHPLDLATNDYHRLRRMPMPVNRQHASRLDSVEHPLGVVLRGVAQVKVNAEAWGGLGLRRQIV